MFVTNPNQFREATPLHAAALLAKNDPVDAPTRIIQANEPLFCEGDESLVVYEIVEGVVRSSKILCDGRRQVISFGYPGDIIGISHDCRYHNDCEAISKVIVRPIRKNVCSPTATTDPQFCQRMLSYAAAEINSMQEHFMMLGRKSARERVASFLVTLMHRVGNRGDGGIAFDLPMSRSDIADFLGLTIETISRSLTQLRKDGVIDLPNAHHVIVRRTSTLRELAESDV